MNTQSITNSIIKTKNISFGGHSTISDETGYTVHKFYLPYDTNNYSAELELVPFRDVNGRWVKMSKAEPVRYSLPKDGMLEIPEADLCTEEKSATGYRFILTGKHNNKIYKIDSGLQSNPLAGTAENTYALLLPGRTVLSINGLTKQVMPDICFPGYSLNPLTGKLEYNNAERERALNAVRTHGSKLGGQLAGIIKMLPVWKEEGYTKIVGTPYTRDGVSSHLYWTENPYQPEASLGSLEDFKTFQRELFRNGINFIADGALVNQGLQGTIFRHVLKHGEDSPFFHWFKASGLLSSELRLGGIPKKPEARENFRFRLVNSPYSITDENGDIKITKNKDYDENKLTYLQLYDKRLVTEKELKNTKSLLRRYSKTNTDNPYDITSHDDVTQLLAFEINPEAFKRNLKYVIENFPKDKRSFNNNGLVEALLNFKNFKITTKDKGGVDLWDGNMDIAKLNFYIGNTDQAYLDKFTNPYERAEKEAELQKGVFQVQDFALKSVKYWSKLVANTQIEYTANAIKSADLKAPNYIQEINNQVSKGNLPQKAKELITEKNINRVFDGSYEFKILDTPDYLKHKKLYLQNAIMEFPLETVEFSPDLTAVLATPYISKRPTSEEDMQKTRHEIYTEKLSGNGPLPDKYSKIYNTADKVLAVEFTNYVNDIFSAIDYNLPENRKLFERSTEKVTDYGKYVITMLLPDVIKFALVKSFKPDANIIFDKERGALNYSNAKIEEISLKSLNIDGNPEQEASGVVKKLKIGLQKAATSPDKQKLINTLTGRIKGISLNDFKVANVIVEQTESGLGWRIDAAKDIATIDALRTNNDNDERLLNSVIDFWKKFNAVAKSENKHVYTTAEITDLEKLMTTKNGEFQNSVNAETKFLERTGLNNTANYMFFYSMLKNLFSLDSETGRKMHFDNIQEFQDKLIHGWAKNGEQICHGFLYQYPDDAIMNSYTFLGNHDKPRVLHLFALDMALFHSDFTSQDHKDRARRVLNLGYEQYLYPYELSGKSIAMGERIITALVECGAIIPYENNNANDIQKHESYLLREAIAHLASGHFNGKTFNPDAFGTRDFRHAIKHVFEEAQRLGYKNPNAESFKDNALKIILEPAMDKMETVYKMLVTLPGSPTDFIGDKEGVSGYETKANNDYQQNRNAVPFEWINETLKNKDISDNNKKSFVNTYYQRMNNIGALRTKKELSALSNGSTVVLPLQTGEIANSGEQVKVAAVFRYNDKGSQVLSLYTTAGASDNNYYHMGHPCVNLEEIILDTFYWKEGIKGGLKEGDLFKKAGDNSYYVVVLENGTYKLKRRNDSAYKSISILPQDKNTAVFYKVNPEEYKPKLIYPNMNY